MARRAAFVITAMLMAASASAQPAAPARAAARAADHVIVLMLDGTRVSDLRLANTPNIDALSSAGAHYLQGRTIYPSQTRVAFVSLPTGAWPGSHGVVGGDDYRDASWKVQTMGRVEDPLASLAVNKRPTMFEEATAAGMTSYYAAMKGYELVGSRGVTWHLNLRTEPDLQETWDRIYEPTVDGSEEKAMADKKRLTRELLDRSFPIIEKNKPNLMILNLGSIDYAGHVYGPGSPHYRATIEHVDSLIGELLAKLDAWGMRARTTIVITADHGFSDVGGRVFMADANRQIPTLTAAKIEHHITNAGGNAVGIYVRDKARVAEVVKLVRQQPWAESVHCELPAARCDRSLSSLGVYMPGRSPEVMVDLDDDASIDRLRLGNHGSYRSGDMSIPLILSGAGIKQGIYGKGRLIDVAPTALKLLGLPGKVLRPDGRVLTEALAH